MFRQTSLLALLCVVVLVYLPGLNGDFLFDDTSNIVQNDAIRIGQLDVGSLKRAAFSSVASPLGRPVSMVSFALNYYFSGLAPLAFKLTNLAIHLLNACLIYVLSRLLLGQVISHSRDTDTVHWGALAVAAIWALHPLNLTSVLYIVQRMTSLSALFTLIGVVAYAWGRQRMIAGKPGGISIVVAGLVVCAPLAVLSKENGALLPTYLLIIEWLVFRFAASNKVERAFLYALYILTVFLPLLWVIVHTVLDPQWLLAGYRLRDYSLVERLYTEARVLWFYLRMIFAPDLSMLGMYHDDIELSRSLYDPASTFWAVVGLCGLMAVALLLRKQFAILSFGIVWFLVGHSMESTIYPLEIAHEHRNYLPMFGPIIAAIYYLLPRRDLDSRVKLFRAVTIGGVLLLASVTALRAQQFGSDLRLNLVEAEHHPASARANLGAGRAMIMRLNQNTAESPAYYDQARRYLETATRLDTNSKGALVAMIYLNQLTGKPTDDSTFAVLISRLHHVPMVPADCGHLTNLIGAIIEGVVSLTHQEVRSIFDAALENPTIDPQSKSILLASLRDYFLVVFKDTDAALMYARMATKVNPRNVILRMDYSKQLMNAGDYKAASEEIRRAEDNDVHKMYVNDIQQLRSRLLNESALR